MPSLCSRLAGRSSLATPRRPSSPTAFCDARNSESPRTPGGASGVRARTMWMMLGAMSWSPQVMKIFWPVSRQPPSPSGAAMVWMAARSVPA